MPRHLFPTLLLPLLVIALSCSDDTPTGGDPGPDFKFGDAKNHFIPLTPGTELILQGTRTVTNQMDSVIIKERCEMVFRVDERTITSYGGWKLACVFLMYIFPARQDPIGVMCFRASRDTVYTYDASRPSESSARIFLLSPFQVGATWDFGWIPATIGSVNEIVNAPGRLFSQVVRVDYGDPSSQSTLASIYYAEGVGFVRWVEKSNSGGDRSVIDVSYKSKNY
jgi:hypothetical protein